MQRRVLRGGSFINNERNARCACRNDNDIANFNNNIGFRVVVASHASLFFEGFKGLPLCRMPAVLYVHGRKPRRNRRDSAVIALAGRFPCSSMGGESGLGEGVQANIKEAHASMARPSQHEPPFLTPARSRWGK
ncbi:MAG: SUMF1/EgtB/PvdO family nonheme iron enzyme [Chloroflexi bacterium]|nr:SUMF1/EgtB/PvdO family nonheme iron enzyme [Chloroflexota bacterium]